MISQAAAGSGGLTPSELVFLNAPAFAPRPGVFDKFKVLGSEDEVSRKGLAQVVYAAAFLAAERAGGVRLEMRSKKVLLGLRTVTGLYVEPTGDGAPAWPAECLEATLRPLAERLRARKNQHEVSGIVYTFLQEDSANPFEAALEAVRCRLAERGWLAISEQKKLKIFTVRSYSLPGETAALAQARAEEASQLLAECQNGRPELWQMLLAEVKTGIARRTKQDDPGASGSSSDS